MRPADDADIRFRQYLLGDLPEEPQEQMEERLMTDDAVYEELRIQENELIDDFVRGNLPETEEEKFNRHFLCTSERRQKLRFAQALEKYIQAAATEMDDRTSFRQRIRAYLDSPALRIATAAALIVVVVGGSFALSHRLGQEVAELESETTSLQGRTQDLRSQLDTLNEANAKLTESLGRERQSRVAAEQELSSLRRSRPASSNPTQVAYVLQPGLLRDLGEQTQRVPISETTNLVKLQLDIGIDDYTSYRVVLHDAVGEELLVQNKLEAQPNEATAVVPIDLPASLIPHGDYHIRLTGRTGAGDFELVGRYHFRTTQTKESQL
jgi:hypothetical protein